MEALTVPFGWESIAIPGVLGTGGYWRVARRPSVQPSDAKPGAGPVVSPVRGIEFRLDADLRSGAMAIEYDQATLRQTGGELAAKISTTFVQLLKEHADRGPTKCRTYIDEDLIIVLMRGGYSRMEDTLFEDGKWLDVRSMRHTFQDTMEGRFTETIERLTGREVAAFMSASHQHPDIQIEAFVLDGGSVPQGSPDALD